MIIDRLVAAVARQKKDDKGFSLIELLVVVIIIGILAAIAIPIFLNQRQGAWRSAVESDVANARIAVETALTRSNGSLTNVTFPGPADAPGDNIDADGTDIPFTVSPNVTITITDEGDNAYLIVGAHDDLDETYSFDSTTGISEWDE